MQQFEVYCLNCGVTFPVGTKRCLHCGGPLAKGTGGSPLLHETISIEASNREPRPQPSREPRLSRVEGQPTRSPVGPFAEAEADDELPEQRSILRAGMSVIWLMIIALGMLARICSGHGGG